MLYTTRTRQCYIRKYDAKFQVGFVRSRATIMYVFLNIKNERGGERVRRYSTHIPYFTNSFILLFPFWKQCVASRVYYVCTTSSLFSSAVNENIQLAGLPSIGTGLPPSPLCSAPLIFCYFSVEILGASELSVKL